MNKISHLNCFRGIVAGAALGLALAAPPLARAQLAISVNDSKAVLDNGTVRAVANPPADTLTLLDLSVFPPKVVGDIDAAGSVQGPPLSVAITPDETLALVTVAQRVEGGRLVADNRLLVVDISSRPPVVMETLRTGLAPAGVSISASGTFAMVANRGDGTVSLFTIAGRRVTPAGSLLVGHAGSGPSHVAITPDGRRALVTRDGDNRVSFLAFDEKRQLFDTGFSLATGSRPYGIDISRDGLYAAVANIGTGDGRSDTVSLIDIDAKVPAVLHTLAVGQTPEGILFSPSGRHVAVVVMNGSNKPADSPHYAPNGRLVMLRVDAGKLRRVASTRIGKWSQGVAFSPNGRLVLVQNMVEKTIQLLRWREVDEELTDTEQVLTMRGGPAAIRTATRP